MSLALIPYEPAHIFALDVIDAQRAWREQEEAPLLADVLARHPAWTAVDDAGEPVACGGVACMEDGVYVAWAMCGKATAKHVRAFLTLARYVIQRCAILPRIEARIYHDENRDKAQRFAEAVGLRFVEERDGYALHVRT